MTAHSFLLARRDYLKAAAAFPLLRVTGTASAATEELGTLPSYETFTGALTAGADQETPHILAWGGGANLFHPERMGHIPDGEKVDTLLSVHPDTFWSTRITGFAGPPMETHFVGDARHQVTVASRYGYDPVVGRMGEMNTAGDGEGEWYQGLPDERKWQYPDGRIVEDPTRAAARKLDGSRVKNEARAGPDAYSYEPSKHVPGLREFYADIAEDVVAFGAGGIWIDGGTNWGFRDYSEWAAANFRDHLADLSEDELAALGVTNPQTLDPIAEIKSRTPPSEDENPATDPLWREFVKEDYRAIRETFQTVRDRLDDAYPKRNTVLFSNQCAFLDLPELAALTAKPLTFPGLEAQLSLPPVFITDFVQKAITASNPDGQTGYHMGTAMVRDPAIEALRESEFDTESVQPDLLATQLADQIANGTIGTVALSGDYNVGDTLSDVPGNWMADDATVPVAARKITGFAWTHREILRGGQPVNDTAVILSLPTFMWNRADAWDIRNDDHSDSFAGACTVVREAGHSYDVRTFGHPDLWDDTDTLDALPTYDTVVLPAIECLSPDQRTALVAAADAGTRVLITDGEPVRDHEYRQTDHSILTDHAHVHFVSETPARDRWRNDGAGQVLTDALSDPSIGVDTAHPVGVVARRQQTDNGVRTVVQLVNYDFDLDSAQTQPATDVTLTVPFENASRVVVHRPGQPPTALDPSRTVSLPAIEQWGVVVAEPPGTESVPDSTEVVDEATAAVETAMEEGRTFELRVARTLAERAQTALHYGTHALASETAQSAVDATRVATETPVVGIDVAHQQAASGHGWDGFEQFRNLLPELEFVRVENWSRERLDTLDVLVVPAVSQSDTSTFGFTDAEVDAVQAWVEAGGTIVLLGCPSIARDAVKLTARFDVEFDGRPVVNGEGDFYSVRSTRGADTTITRSAPQPASRFITPVDTPGEAITLLAATNGWLERTGGADSFDSGDATTDDRPVSSVHTHGDGLVFVHGSSEDFTNLEFRNGPIETYTRNAIRFLAWLSSVDIDVASTTSPTTTTTTTTSESSTSAQSGDADSTTNADSPGFTVGTAGLALGITALIERYLRD